MKNFLFSVLKGIALGAGCILPGISSGVLCVIFGIYDKLVNSILNIFKDFRKNFLFLLPIFIGVGIGILLFGNILRVLFNNYENSLKLIFAGLILGSIPSILNKANNGHIIRVHYFIYTILTFLLAIFLIFIENNMHNFGTSNINFAFLFISGFLMSIGVIFPGVSSTIILMCLGIYSIYLEAVSLLNLSILIPMGLGLICGCIVFLNIINFFMNKFPIQTMYSIIGFVMGSIFILLPNSFSLTYILLFVIGLLISLFFESFSSKNA